MIESTRAKFAKLSKRTQHQTSTTQCDRPTRSTTIAPFRTHMSAILTRTSLRTRHSGCLIAIQSAYIMRHVLLPRLLGNSNSKDPLGRTRKPDPKRINHEDSRMPIPDRTGVVDGCGITGWREFKLSARKNGH